MTGVRYSVGDLGHRVKLANEKLRGAGRGEQPQRKRCAEPTAVEDARS